MKETQKKKHHNSTTCASSGTCLLLLDANQLVDHPKNCWDLGGPTWNTVGSWRPDGPSWDPVPFSGWPDFKTKHALDTHRIPNTQLDNEWVDFLQDNSLPCLVSRLYFESTSVA